MISFGMVVIIMVIIISIKIPELALGTSNIPVTERALQLQNISDESFNANAEEYYKIEKETRDNLVQQEDVSNRNTEILSDQWRSPSINNLSNISDNFTRDIKNTNNSINLDNAVYRNHGQDESMENRVDPINVIPIINASEGILTYMVIPTLQISEWKRHIQDEITYLKSDHDWTNDANNIHAFISPSILETNDSSNDNITEDQNYLTLPFSSFEGNSTNSISEMYDLLRPKNFSLLKLHNNSAISNTSIHNSNSFIIPTFTPLRYNSGTTITNYTVPANIYGSYLPDEIVQKSKDFPPESLSTFNPFNSKANASNVIYLTKIERFSEMDKNIKGISANISYIQNDPLTKNQIQNISSYTVEEIHPTPTYKEGLPSYLGLTNSIISSSSTGKLNFTQTETNSFDHSTSVLPSTPFNLTSEFVPNINDMDNSHNVIDKVISYNAKEFILSNDSSTILSSKIVLQTANMFGDDATVQPLLSVPLSEENITKQENFSKNGNSASDLDNYILSMDFDGNEEGNLRISLSGRVFWLKPTAVAVPRDTTSLSQIESIQTINGNSTSNEIINDSFTVNHLHQNSLSNITVTDKVIIDSPILESSFSETSTIKTTVTEVISRTLIVIPNDFLLENTSSSQSNSSIYPQINILPSLSDNFLSVNVSVVQNPFTFTALVSENNLNTSLNDVLVSEISPNKYLSVNSVFPTVILNVSSNSLHIHQVDHNHDDKVNSSEIIENSKINEIQFDPVYNKSDDDFKLHLENKQLATVVNESMIPFNITFHRISQTEKLLSNTVQSTVIKHDPVEGDVTIPISQEDYILDEDTRIDEGIMDFLFTSPQPDEQVEGDKNPLDNEVNLDLSVLTTPSLEHDIQFIFPLPEHEQPSAEPPFDAVETNSLENLDNTIKEENFHSGSPAQNEKNIIFSKNVSVNAPEWPVINKHFTIQTNTENQIFTDSPITTESVQETKKKNSTTSLGYDVSTASHPIELPPVFSLLKLKLPQTTICKHKEELQEILSKALGMVLNTIITTNQVKLFASEQPWSEKPLRSIPLCHNSVSNPPTAVLLYIESNDGSLDEFLTRTLGKELLQQNIQLSGTVFENQIYEVQIYPREEEIKIQPNPNYYGTVAAITIAGIAGTCLMLLCILLIVMKLNNRKARRCHPALDNYSLDSLSLYSTLHGKKASVMSHTYLNHGFEDSSVLSHQVNFAGLANICCDQDLTLEEEFKLLPATKLKLEDLPEGVEEKNRYSNIIPIPETRVLLSNNEDEAKANSDYINANFVRGYHGLYNEYIACQAPMENTTADFWQMVWEQQSKVIIALNSMEDGEMLLSAPYLPKSQVDCHRLFGDFQITLKAKETLEKYIISTIILRNLEKNLMREIVHFWYTAWPVKGVPDECWSILAMLLEVRPLVTKNSSPTIVHCATGTGRTGTVIAIDICIREFEKTRMVDVPKSVYRLRQDRSGAVQTSQQYAYIYQVLNEYAIRLITPSL